MYPEKLITKIEDNLIFHGITAEIDYNEALDRIIIDSEALLFSFPTSQYSDDLLIEYIKYLK